MGGPGSWQHCNHATSISITVLGAFFVGLRFLSRHLGKVPPGAEDVFILVALVCSLLTMEAVLTIPGELIRHFCN